jgi:hypothetical protein
MNVAAAKPNSPMIEGAATGRNEICEWLRQNSNSPSGDGARNCVMMLGKLALRWRGGRSGPMKGLTGRWPRPVNPESAY